MPFTFSVRDILDVLISNLASKKILKKNCPILIFDDPVNAIDDEHRAAIRETLFKDSFFEQTQIILAIHGEEFFNNTHQMLGKERAAISQSYIFSPISLITIYMYFHYNALEIMC